MYRNKGTHLEINVSVARSFVMITSFVYVSLEMLAFVCMVGTQIKRFT